MNGFNYLRRTQRGYIMTLTIEIDNENDDKIKQLRQLGVNITEYFNTLIKKEDYSPLKSFAKNNQ